MSKKKSAKKKKSAASARRPKPATRSRRPKARARATPPGTVQLKPISVLIDRAILDLQRLPPSDATDITLKHLQGCAMAFADICDPDTPGGCAPNMEFPRGALATSR